MSSQADKTEQFRLGILMACEEIRQFISARLLNNREEMALEQNNFENQKTLATERDAYLEVHSFVEGVSRANHSAIRQSQIREFKASEN